MATNNQLLMHFAANQASSDNIWEAVLVAYNAHWKEKKWMGKKHTYTDMKWPIQLNPGCKYIPF